MKIIHKLLHIIDSASPALKKRLGILFIFLLVLNVGIWACTFFFSYKYPVLLGLVTLAYGLGLRHAVDADHIAAIDNTTRKLMQEGKRPVAVGFFFSLGHSTIVVGLSLLVALSASFVQHSLPSFRQTGTLIGTGVSSFFLLFIGIINLIAFLDIFKVWRKVTKGNVQKNEIHNHMHITGFLAKIFKPFTKAITQSWHMYPLGFLFGLGFDTASEVGLLSISAATGATGMMPLWAILLLPLAFTGAMALVDSIDGVLMLGAYGWAYIKPVRKLYYNLNITLLSVIVALFIGGVEGLQLISSKLGLQGGFFSAINSLNFGNLGYVIIGAFIIIWIISLLLYRFKKYDMLDIEIHAHK